MQVVLSTEAEAIIQRRVSSGEFETAEAAVEASILFFGGEAAISDLSRDALLRELRGALEDSRRNDLRAVELDALLLKARKLRRPRASAG